MDILAAGNMFHTEVETSRYDASVGYFLKGDGKGQFQLQANIKSGFSFVAILKRLGLLNVGQMKMIIVGNNNSALDAFLLNR